MTTGYDPDDYADGWKPEPGSVVVGRILRIDAGWSDYRARATGDGAYPIITIDDEKTGKPVAVHGFQAALYNRLRQDRPRAGERIGIKFVEKRPHRSDPSMEVAVYRVRIEGRTGDDVWDRLGTPQRPAPPVAAPAGHPAPPRLPVPATAADYISADVDTDADDDIPF